MAIAELVGGDVTTLQRWIQLAHPSSRLFCDNVVIHRSKLVQSWLAANPRWSGCTGRTSAATTTEVDG